MIVQSPESDMPEPYRSYVRQRSKVIASVLEDVEARDVQLCPRAILPEERFFSDDQSVVYGAVVKRLCDGYKNVLYTPSFRKNSHLGIATVDTAHAAEYAAKLLSTGDRVRIKDPLESDGKGQSVVASARELKNALEPFQDTPESSVVAMPHLEEVYDRVSIGRIKLHDLAYIYIGRENTVTVDGEEVYGGTELGLFPERAERCRDIAEKYLQVPRLLSQLGLNAIGAYDKVASEVGRVSFDIIQGITASGTPVTDVVDITPRVSGATPAEVLALRAVCRSLPRPAISFAKSQLLYSPDSIPSTGTNFVETDSLVINADVMEIAQ